MSLPPSSSMPISSEGSINAIDEVSSPSPTARVTPASPDGARSSAHSLPVSTCSPMTSQGILNSQKNPQSTADQVHEFTLDEQVSRQPESPSQATMVAKVNSSSSPRYLNNIEAMAAATEIAGAEGGKTAELRSDVSSTAEAKKRLKKEFTTQLAKARALVMVRPGI